LGSDDIDGTLAVLTGIRTEAGGKPLKEALFRLKRSAAEAEQIRRRSGIAETENLVEAIPAKRYVKRLRMQMYGAWFLVLLSLVVWLIR
jgi:hypothetical protein